MTVLLDDTCTLLGELISFPTVSSDSNLEMIAHLAGRLEHVGARVDVHLDETGKKANLFATLGPEDVDGGIVLSGTPMWCRWPNRSGPVIRLKWPGATGGFMAVAPAT